MRIALVSDIHANFQALKAVLDSIQKKGIETIWFLGDAVGRGPNPNQVLDWLEGSIMLGNGFHWVLGNHDAMLADLLTESEWSVVNDIPRKTIELQRGMLMEKGKHFIGEYFHREKSSPQVFEIDQITYFLSHGSLTDASHMFRYVFPWNHYVILPDELFAMRSRLSECDSPAVLCFGHTHVPTLIEVEQNGESAVWDRKKVIPGRTYQLDLQKKAFINPGSVGQPRDLDNRAAYAILDTVDHTVTFKRVTYDWRTTARELFNKGYHDSFIAKLRDANPVSETPPEWLEHYHAAKRQDDE